MNKKNKKQQRQQYNVRMFVECIEPYWKIIAAISLAAGFFFSVGVWVGEHNKLDEISKIRSEYAEKITTLTIELANQDRRPIIVNLNDSIKK